MSVIEIILLLFGIIIFILSYLIPAKKEKNTSVQMNEEAIRKMVDQEVENAKDHISDIVDETVTYAMEKTERSMERLTNEKIMAVNEYSDTVLQEINKNHKEVVFLYDMLNDKHENLKNTVTQVEKTASEVKQVVKDAELTAKEVEEKAAFVPFAPEKVEVPSSKETPVKKQDVLTAKEPVWKNEAVEEEPVKEKLPDGKMAVKVSKKETENASAADVPNVTVALDQMGRAGKRNSNERILELHKAGKSNMAIAKELGLGIGEVKLVIDLFEGM